MEWFECWFGEEYLLVYEHRSCEQARHESQAAIGILNLEPGERVRIRKLAPLAVNKLDEADLRFFHEALHSHTRREWRSSSARTW